MSILDKHPAPWRVHDYVWVDGTQNIDDANGNFVMRCSSALAEQVCLWANAEAVQRQRGISALKENQPGYEGWYAVDEKGKGIDCSMVRGTKEWPILPTPAAAIVQAAEFLSIPANVENHP